MKKNFRPLSLLIAGSLTLGLGACSKDEPNPNSQVTVVAQSTVASGSNSGGRMAAGVVLESFVVNIREIELEYDDPNSDVEIEDETLEKVYEDQKLNGPFVVDLLTQAGMSTINELTSTTAPNAVYEEIEFKMHKNDVVGSPMLGKSIYAKGTINGTPFVFWHNTDEEFEIDFEDAAKNLALNGQPVDVVLSFNLGLLFDSVQGIDLSNAKDSDGDGVIEIDPLDTDGNGNLAHDIKKALEEVTDLMDKK